jgi:clan AA aspartic protease
MISGSVNARREAIITVTLIDPSGRSWDIDAVVDTGFNGEFTLSPQAVAAMGLQVAGTVPVLMPDGREDLLDLYRATNVWDGASRTVDVDAANTDPLVGMKLLAGYDVRIQVAEGGAVTIEPMA